MWIFHHSSVVSWLACPPLAKVQRRIFGTLSCFLTSDTAQQRFCRATSSNDFVTLPQLDRHAQKLIQPKVVRRCGTPYSPRVMRAAVLIPIHA